MHSWGSDTPQEVFWGLNDLVKWAKTKGFDNKELWFDDLLQVDVNDQESTIKNNEQLVKELNSSKKKIRISEF